MRPRPAALALCLAAPLGAGATPLDDALAARCAPDARLAAAAAAALADPHGFSPRELRDRTWANDLRAPAVHALVLRGGDGTSLADAAGRWLDRHAVSPALSRCAVAFSGELTALALAPRAVAIEPLAPRGDVRAWRVAAVPGATEVALVATAPDGDVRRATVAADGVTSLAMREDGVWTVQVTATFATGPAPVALWAEAVGDARPAPAAEFVDVTNDRRLLGAINALRRERGVAPLRRDPLLDRVAREHAARLAEGGDVAHTPAPGRSPVDRLRAAGVSTPRLAENLARARTLAEAHARLLGSPGHRANLLDAEVDAAGFGTARAGGMLYLVELFATRPSMREPGP